MTTETTAAALRPGVVVDTVDGPARIVTGPNHAGISRVRFADGAQANLDVHVERFTIVPEPVGPIRYLHAEYAAWSTDRDELDRTRADRKDWEESDNAGLALLTRMAAAVGLILPSDDTAHECGWCGVALRWAVSTEPLMGIWQGSVATSPTTWADRCPVNASHLHEPA